MLRLLWLTFQTTLHSIYGSVACCTTAVVARSGDISQILNNPLYLALSHKYIISRRRQSCQSMLIPFAWDLLGSSFLLVQLISDSTEYAQRQTLLLCLSF